MYSMPCLFGRTQVASLAAMNLRAVVGAGEITYVTRPPAKPAAITRLLGAKFQPRDEHGRFVTYADFKLCMDLEYSWTAYEYDVEDGVRTEGDL